MGGHKEGNSEKGIKNAYKQVQISRLQVQHIYVISSWLPLAFLRLKPCIYYNENHNPQTFVGSTNSHCFLKERNHYTNAALTVISLPHEHREKVQHMQQKVQNTMY